MDKNRGSAYILVLIIMMTVFTSLSIVSNISRFQIIVTDAYKLNINDYDMAVSGIQKTLNILNRELHAHKYNIYYELLNELISDLKNDVLFYKTDSVLNKYKGNFLVNNDMVNNYLSELAYKYIEKSLDSMFVKDKNNYLYNYIVSLDNEYINNSYKVHVIIKPLNKDNDHGFHVESVVMNEVTGNRNSVTGTIFLNKLYGKSIVYPEFEWKHEKFFLGFSIFVGNSVQTLGSVSGKFMSYQSDIKINDGISLNENNWSYENPIIIVNNAHNTFIDISKFYFGDEILSTVIINNTDISINLYTSDSSKNNFKGIVFSRYDIIIDNVNVEGSIVSLGDVFIMSNASLVFTENKGIIFNIRAQNKELYYKVLDYLGITDFNSMVYNETKSNSELSSILKSVNLSKFSKFELFEQKDIMYNIFEITQ